MDKNDVWKSEEFFHYLFEVDESEVMMYFVKSIIKVEDFPLVLKDQTYRGIAFHQGRIEILVQEASDHLLYDLVSQVHKLPLLQIVLTKKPLRKFVEVYTYRSESTILNDALKTMVISLPLFNREKSYENLNELEKIAYLFECDYNCLPDTKEANCLKKVFENYIRMKDFRFVEESEEVEHLQKKCQKMADELKNSEQRVVQSQLLFVKNVLTQRFGDINLNFLEYLSSAQIQEIIDHSITISIRELKRYQC